MQKSFAFGAKSIWISIQSAQETGILAHMDVQKEWPLRMATEELELRQQIAEAKAEEKTYEESEEEQNIDGMNENLKDVKVKLTSTPISPGAQPNDQATPKVPSVKLQSSAIVSTSSMTTPVTTPALVSGANMNPTA